jgi:hypothetical protein
MQSDEYRRLRASCLTMAKQSNSPDVRARWLVLAKDCEDVLEASSATGGRWKSISTRLRARAAVQFVAA